MPDKSVYDRYQIILHPIRKGSTLCQLYLRVYPLQWYNNEKGKDEHIEEKANYYIAKVNKEQDKDDGFRSDLKPDDSYKELKDYDKCKTCGFYVKEKYCIYGTNETKEFYTAARFNGCPVITISPKEHFQNEDWFKTIQILQYRLCDVVSDFLFLVDENY